MENQNENTNENPVRRSIDDLLKDDLPSTNSGSGLPAFNEHTPMNYVEAKDTSMNSAKKLMNSLLKFYLSEELIQKNEYIQLKARVDVMTMAQLIYQMQTAEHAITILMRSIDAGEVSPRMFEVLGGLQKTMLDIMKHQTLHMMASEENMKKLKRDIDIYSDPQPKIIEAKSVGTVNRGTRNLMKEIQAEIGNEEKTDPDDFDSEEQTDF
jgi:hypothetical protein